MKTCSALALFVFLSLAATSSLDAAAQFGRGRDRVCVYQDIHYQGWEQCYGPGDEIANFRDHNKNVSSIRISGRLTVTVYEDTNFRGRSAEFNSDVPDLGLRIASGSNSWSDRIESMRVSSDFGGTDRNGNPGFGRPSRDPGDGICVYERPNYQGRSECWNAGSDVRDLGRVGGWSDRISSVRVFGRSVAVFYQDIGFQGERLAVDRDIPNLAQLRLPGSGNWSRQISSLQVEFERGRGRGRDFRR